MFLPGTARVVGSSLKSGICWCGVAGVLALAAPALAQNYTPNSSSATLIAAATSGSTLHTEGPIYDGNGKDAKATGAKRVLEYGLRNNSFTVKQLSKDSTDKTTAAVAQQLVKPAATAPAKSKKHTAEKKHKKKKHHHSSDDQ